MSDASNAESGPTQVPIEAKLAWTGHEEIAPVLANQLLVRVDATNGGIPDLVTLLFGLAEAPVVVGDEAQQLAQLQGLTVIESRTVAKVAFGTGRLREFANVLLQVADKVDTALGRGEEK